MQNKNFFKAFLENPRQTGSVIQSSPFLIDRILKPVNFEKAKVIVELGAGTGVVTKKILKNMTENSMLLSFEVNKSLCKELKSKVKDPRLKVISDGAEKLPRYLKRYEVEEVDYIISELPLVVLPKEMREKILFQITRHLKKGGQYVQFQYSLASKKKFKTLFSEMKIYFTLLNIPPAFVYVCTK